MIKTIHGDLMEAKETYIVHQVNCYGAMGRGVAAQIRSKYPDVYRRYQEYCADHFAKKLLGKVLLVLTDDGKVVCNVFGQERFGVGKMHTDIAALSKALTSLAKIIPYNEPIAMPYMIGCGLGGASWDIVYPVIRDIFTKHTVVLYRK